MKTYLLWKSIKIEDEKFSINNYLTYSIKVHDNMWGYIIMTFVTHKLNFAMDKLNYIFKWKSNVVLDFPWNNINISKIYIYKIWFFKKIKNNFFVVINNWCSRSLIAFPKEFSMKPCFCFVVWLYVYNCSNEHIVK